MEPPTGQDRTRWLLTLAVLGGIVCVAALWWYRAAPPEAVLLPVDDAEVAEVAESLPVVEANQTQPQIGVDVVGAVQRPGLYFFEPGARVADAIKAAGGYAPNADRDAINEAVRLEDEQQLRVPQVVVGAAGTAVAPPAAATASPAATAPTLLDLNTADVRALELLPGIGPRMAERIVAYRTANGAFGSVEQLQDVPGIGPATFATLRDYMTVTP